MEAVIQKVKELEAAINENGGSVIVIGSIRETDKRSRFMASAQGLRGDLLDAIVKLMESDDTAPIAKILQAGIALGTLCESAKTDELMQIEKLV